MTFFSLFNLFNAEGCLGVRFWAVTSIVVRLCADFCMK